MTHLKHAHVPELDLTAVVAEQPVGELRPTSPEAEVRAEVEGLHAVLDAAQEASGLADEPVAFAALDDFVVRVQRELAQG